MINTAALKRTKETITYNYLWVHLEVIYKGDYVSKEVQCHRAISFARDQIDQKVRIVRAITPLC